MQSRTGALLFANGAIYAVRRSLYRPVEGDWDHDTMVPLRCVLAGSRVVYEPHALAYEKAGTTARGELRRKVRIIMRDAWTLVDLARVHVGLTPWLLFNVLCHKVIRWLVWLPLVGLLALSVINFDHAFFRVTLAAQLAFYVAALAGKLIERRRGAPIWLRVPLYFCLVNTAGLLASVRMLRGERQTFWNPRSGA
ncbi:MAG: glycosyltransferase [Candidatus Krumholzibacteriia bacterium]